jgi:hypothetical protein
MGNVDGSNLSTLPNSCSCYGSRQILPHLLPMVSSHAPLESDEADLQGVATTCHPEEDRDWTSGISTSSVES